MACDKKENVDINHPLNGLWFVSEYLPETYPNPNGLKIIKYSEGEIKFFFNTSLGTLVVASKRSDFPISSGSYSFVLSPKSNCAKLDLIIDSKVIGGVVFSEQFERLVVTESCLDGHQITLKR